MCSRVLRCIIGHPLAVVVLEVGPAGPRGSATTAPAGATRRFGEDGDRPSLHSYDRRHRTHVDDHFTRQVLVPEIVGPLPTPLLADRAPLLHW